MALQREYPDSNAAMWWKRRCGSSSPNDITTPARGSMQTIFSLKGLERMPAYELRRSHCSTERMQAGLPERITQRSCSAGSTRHKAGPQDVWLTTCAQRPTEVCPSFCDLA